MEGGGELTHTYERILDGRLILLLDTITGNEREKNWEHQDGGRRKTKTESPFWPLKWKINSLISNFCFRGIYKDLFQSRENP